MPELSDADARPLKRARLDDSTIPPNSAARSLTETASTEAPQAQAPTAVPDAPIAAHKTAADDVTAKLDKDIEKEYRAGITEYVCPDNLGFTGILKKRYTDFMVNEIGVDGVVVHLKSVDGGFGERRNERNRLKEEGKEPVKEEKELNGKQEEGPKEAGDGLGENLDVKMEEAVDPPNQQEAAKADAPEMSNGHMESKVDQNEAVEPSEEDLATLHSIFGESTTTQILSLVRSIRRKGDRKAKDFKPVIAPPITEKDVRTQAHRSLRRIFPDLLESSMEADQSIRIKAVPPQERKGNKKNKGENRRDRNQGSGRRQGQLGWDELGGEYLHFTLYKENKDTMEIVGFLGSKLKSGAKAFSFAGTKDRRACTVQRVCVKRQTAERMNGLNRILFNAAIGDYSYQNRDLGLGDLVGNEFIITLRDCHFQGEDGLDLAHRSKLANEIVSKAIKDFYEKGFINYYGLQRFGSFSASTDAVGLKMLQGDLKGAVDDLLAYTEAALAAAEGKDESSTVMISQDDRNRAKALHLWKMTGKGSAPLELLPRKFAAERSIIQHLSSRNSKSGKHDRITDYQGALATIPRTLRLMYVHAYQSLVWNAVAGKRWTTYGDNVVEGDLVLVHEHKDKEPSAPEVPKTDIDQDGEFVIDPTGDDSAYKDDDIFERARPLTAAEASSGHYSIFDVVLPQPGFDVEYPKNSIGKFYEEFMGSERGGGLDPHKMRRSWKEVSLSGGYRKFLARPLKELEYEVREYVREDEQFVETDLQKLGKGREGGGGEKRKVNDGETDVKTEDEGEKKLAVVLRLQLASSQYATIALRELMKAGGVKAYKPEFMGGR